jgi:hypothetical protein
MIWDGRNIYTAGTGCYSEGEGPRRFRLTNIEMKNGTGTANVTVNDEFQFINAKVHDNGVGTTDHSIYNSCDGVLIDGGRWYDTSGYSLHVKGKPDCTGTQPNNWIVRNAEFWNGRSTQRSAIYMHHCGSGHQVYNNIFRKFRTGAVAIHAPGSKIWNNTFDCIGNTTCNGGLSPETTQGDIYTGAGNIEIRGNIFSRSGMARLIHTTSTVSAALITHNATDKSTFTIHSSISGTINNNSVNQNYQFVNAGNGQNVGNDYHQQAGGDGIDTGVTLSLVTTDKDGNPRPQGSYDIGAYEYTSPKPATPTGLQIVDTN